MFTFQNTSDLFKPKLPSQFPYWQKVDSYLPALSGILKARPMLSFKRSKALSNIHLPATPDAQTSTWNCWLSQFKVQRDGQVSLG